MSPVRRPPRGQPPRPGLRLTSFIRRQRELQELKGLLGDQHLVTLLGAGGLGKTRPALQLGAEVLDEFDDGCWFVDLAPLSDPASSPGPWPQRSASVRSRAGRHHAPGGQSDRQDLLGVEGRAKFEIEGVCPPPQSSKLVGV